MKIDRDCSLPLEPMTCAATVFAMYCSLKAEQGLQAARLLGVVGQTHLLQPEPLDLEFQIAIFLPHSAQVDVVAPHAAQAVLAPDQGFLERSDGTHRPQADDSGGFVGAGTALDLDRQTQHLYEQDRHQDG